MFKRTWTLLQALCLLDHVEQHKGPEGLYMKKRDVAYKNSKSALDQECPNNGKSVEQIANKLEKISKRWTKPWGRSASAGNLFRSGWGALQDKYSRNRMLGQATEQDPGDNNDEELDSAASGYRPKRRRDTSADSAIRVSKTTRLCKEDGKIFESEGFSRRSVTGYKRVPSPIVLISNTRSAQVSTRDTPGQETEIRKQQQQQQETPSGWTDDDEIFNDRVRSYLNDPTEYLPSVSVLEHLSDGLIRDIHDAVHDLLDDTYTAADKSTQLGVSLTVQSSKGFARLCCGMYGVVTKEELLKLLSGPCLQSQLGLEHFLRAAVAAAIYDWVFQGQHSPLPRDWFEMSGVAAVYSKLASSGKPHQASRVRDQSLTAVARIVIPKLHEQLFRQSKQVVVNEELDLTHYVSGLSFRLIDVLTPFLKENLDIFDEKSMTKWNECIPSIFDRALRLALQATLHETTIEYEWPRFNDSFDARMMKSDDLLLPRGDGVVLAVFFPSMQRKGGSNSQDEGCRRPILRARVQLQS